MPEIKPDLTDENRCVSVHWNLPVQCVLPSSHRENWHEAWHPQTGNRLRYRRSFGNYATEELHHGEWHDLEIPPPNGFCNDQHSTVPKVRCTGQYGHGWNHRAVVDGCTYSWNTPIPAGLTVDQLTRDVTHLRGMLVAAHARIAELETTSVPDEVEYGIRMPGKRDVWPRKEFRIGHWEKCLADGGVLVQRVIRRSPWSETPTECPGFEGNPVSDLCAGCHEPRDSHAEAAS